MKIFFVNLFNKLKKPSTLIKVITYIITLLASALSIILAVIGFEGNWYEILAYLSFAIAGVTLFYAVYIFIIDIPNIKSVIINLLNKNKFTSALLSNYGFRTVAFAIISFTVSILYSVSHVAISVMEKSVWFGMLAFYYLALAFMRGGVLTYQKGKKNKTEYDKKLRQIKTFKNVGILLITVTVALTVAVLQMVLINRHFEYAGLMIFVIATYTFYKITMSIINIIKSRKQTDLTIQAVRYINLADSAVSLLALQTALLSAFGGNELGITSAIMNGITGLVVISFIITLGAFMILKSKKEKEKLITELNTNE